MLWFWQPTESAQAVADLLFTDPEGWSADSYVAHHAGANIGIWIANEAYGIHFWLGGRNDYHLRQTTRGADRRHVHAALRHLRNHPALVKAAYTAIARAAIGKAEAA